MVKKFFVMFLAVSAICLITACGDSIEKDAKKAAQLYYESEQNPSDKNEAKFEKFAEEMEKKYESRLDEFEALFEKELEKLENKKSSKKENSFSSDDDDSYDDDDDDSYKTSSKSSSEDWDAILKDYESFIDKYISLMKKAQKGDMNALTEYAEYMEKANDLGEKLGNADDDLTPAQAAKFIKLQAKLANAAASLY